MTIKAPITSRKTVEDIISSNNTTDHVRLEAASLLSRIEQDERKYRSAVVETQNGLPAWSSPAFPQARVYLKERSNAVIVIQDFRDAEGNLGCYILQADGTWKQRPEGADFDDADWLRADRVHNLGDANFVGGGWN